SVISAPVVGVVVVFEEFPLLQPISVRRATNGSQTFMHGVAEQHRCRVYRTPARRCGRPVSPVGAQTYAAGDSGPDACHRLFTTAVAIAGCPSTASELRPPSF